jgi:hypothetical protein
MSPFILIDITLVNYRLSKNGLASVLGVILVCSIIFGGFISTARADIVNTSLQITSITPKTAAVGQQISIIGTISPEPPSGYAFHSIVLSVIDSNGNYRNIAGNKTQANSGTFYFSWTPDIRGEYLVIITYSGEVLAGINYTSCERRDSFLVDPSLPTATPSPSPTVTPEPSLTPEPTPISNDTSTLGIETSLNVTCRSSTTYSNFKVNIQGTLTGNNSLLSDSPIQLSYSIDGGKSWIPLTYLSTDNTGAFQAVWTPMVSGTYFLKASYNGNSEFASANTIVHFAVLPVEDTSVFSVASNSTVTALTFNSTSQELSFKVSGETATTGYVNVYISKTLMSDASNLNVYFDNEFLQPVIQSMGDSWCISFTYHHSSHTISLRLNSDTPILSQQNLLYIAAGAIGAIIAVAAVVVLLKSKRKLRKA